MTDYKHSPSGERADELKISWEKKISMREIAQFYEDKIRELDGKTQRLTEQTKILSEKSQKMMDEMTTKVDKTLDERAGQKISGLNKQILSFEAKIDDLNQRAKIALDFLSKYDDIKTLIESERKIGFDSIRSILEMMRKKVEDSYRETTDKVLRAQKEGNITGILRAQLEVDVIVSDFYRFMYKYDRNYFETQNTFFKSAKTHPEVFLPIAYTHIQGDSNATAELALSTINSMIDDYIKMFWTIKNQDMNMQTVKGPTSGSD